jgi:cellulose synthase/poly-beta-1,6-N-acetylglucosamine synthase-like glycosyltransferase
MQLPETEYIVRLDSDDALKPTYVARMVTALLSDPQAGYAHCAVEEIDERGTVLSVRRLARREGSEKANTSLRRSVHGYRVAANILTFRSTALRACNWYLDSPDFGEDYDLALRMADLGYTNVYLDEVLAEYRVWNDVNDRRRRRKPIEILGLAQIFERSLYPAFQRRNWNCSPIERRKRRIAASCVPIYFSDAFPEFERAEHLVFLRQFGGGWHLELRIAAARNGAGFIFEWSDGAKQRLVKFLKAVFRKFSKSL